MSMRTFAGTFKGSRIWRRLYLVSNNPFGNIDTVSRFLTSRKKLASFLALSFERLVSKTRCLTVRHSVSQHAEKQESGRESTLLRVASPLLSMSSKGIDSTCMQT